MGLRHPMGDGGNGPSKPGCDSHLKLQFHGAKFTSDAGVLAYWELDEQFTLTRLAAERPLDARRGKVGPFRRLQEPERRWSMPGERDCRGLTMGGRSRILRKR